MGNSIDFKRAGPVGYGLYFLFDLRLLIILASLRNTSGF